MGCINNYRCELFLFDFFCKIFIICFNFFGLCLLVMGNIDRVGSV